MVLGVEVSKRQTVTPLEAKNRKKLIQGEMVESETFQSVATQAAILAATAVNRWREKQTQDPFQAQMQSAQKCTQTWWTIL